MCSNCMDPEEFEARHGLTDRQKRERDPMYGDWLYEQERDRKADEKQGENSGT